MLSLHSNAHRDPKERQRVLSGSLFLWPPSWFFEYPFRFDQFAGWNSRVEWLFVTAAAARVVTQTADIK